MVRPEIASRIRETCDISLKAWYKQSMLDLSVHHKFFSDSPFLEVLVREEAEYIAEVLKNRIECPYHHVEHKPSELA